ncbi:T9SS type A sorting domain-containing protein [Rubricoccus marinus]|uniref:LTD domain-containing protein n=1 Tax=Rubricoccus marinus TaxID=716817 RepID=A0A259TXI3_9BACT|nr:T9SS type A sorting domain-containing protein [Rubricoccus marinus]OZC02459.1 hypothetical protein BSZ36_05385 [Rubricoccus marinus]
MKRLLLFLLAFVPALASAQVAGGLYISEFDPDPFGADGGTIGDGNDEFVELYAPGAPNTALTGYVLVFFNGSGGVSYARIDLDTYTTDANGLVVVTQADFPASLQNGPDAIAVYTGDAADFPNGTPVTTTNLVDAAVYSQGNQSRSTVLLAGLGETVQYDEGFGEVSPGDVSFQRLIRDGEGNGISKTFYVFAPSPGVNGPRRVTVDETAAVEGVEGSLGNSDDQGWRMLAMPGFNGATPFVVNDIAAVNLVQGVPAGATSPAQYPAAGANILTSARGESTQDLLNSFAPPTSTDEELLPGAGFFWYFYDLATTAGGNGTSFSRDLADPSFSLAFDVSPPDPFIDGGEYDLTVGAVQQYIPPGNPTPSPSPTVLSRFYFIGNPYAYPYALGGVTPTNNADASVIQDNVYIWNPTVGTSQSNSVTITGSYELRTATPANPFDNNGDASGRLNGFFVELATNSDDDVNFALPSGFQRPRIAAGTVAKNTVEGRLAFTMEGTTTSGKGVLDTATLFRFSDNATFEWDRFDGTNVTSMNQTYAFIAPIGVNNGNPWAQAVYSMPKSITEAHSVPMSFVTTEGGTFTITWDASLLPTGWNVILRDNEAGTSVDLGTADRYEFSAPTTTEEWAAGAERFTVVISPSNVVSNEPVASGAMKLSAPMPNPASGATRLVLTAGASESVRASVYDALGREVAVLHDGPLASGDQKTLTLDTTSLAAGVYVVRAQGENGSLTQRLTVTR